MAPFEKWVVHFDMKLCAFLFTMGIRKCLTAVPAVEYDLVVMLAIRRLRQLIADIPGNAEIRTIGKSCLRRHRETVAIRQKQ